MGGFAGGDEAGYWEEELLLSSKKQVSQSTSFFLDSCSLEFIPCQVRCLSVELAPDVCVDIGEVQKVFEALENYVQDDTLCEFFEEHKVFVKKESPNLLEEFLSKIRQECTLLLSNEELQRILLQVRKGSL